MTAASTTADSTKVVIAATDTNSADDRLTTREGSVSYEDDKKKLNLNLKNDFQNESPNVSVIDHQQQTEDSIDASKSVVAFPKKPAWGLSSAWPGATSTSDVDKKGVIVPVLSFAEIMNGQSRDRAAARVVYSNNVVDETVSLTQIQAEQERLFAKIASKGKKQTSPSSLQDRGRPTDSILSGIDDQERKMIELALKNSLTNCNSISSDDKDCMGGFATTIETCTTDILGPGTVETAEEKSEREMIEAAIREADAKDQRSACTNEMDAKSAATIAELTMSDREKEMIQTAIREADAKEGAAQEAESIKLMMQLQQEEIAIARQRKHHSTMPTGNVRTMTRAELDAETYGDKVPNLPYDDRQYYNGPEAGFRMNQQNHDQPSGWYRRDRNTIVGPDNEIRTKHDVKVQGQTNASFLDLDVIDDETGLRTHVGNTAFNAFRKTAAGNYHTKGGHRGTSKGVATHGTGRAGSDADATKGGALDQHVRLRISKAINAGLIERCNGVVKQGKEAVVYHAVGGISSTKTTRKESNNDRKQSSAGSQIEKGDADENKTSMISKNDRFDVAIKVFKRINEFKGRGEYVDGDPRYAGRPFRSFTDREQLEVWTEKEYRNLARAYRAKVPVPNPIHYKDNIIFMRFMGEDGWPAPQIREINIRKASSKWTALYEQVMNSAQKLFQDARLVHGDLSEYNILIAPKIQVDNKSENVGSDDDLQTVLIDFGQAVEVRHPKAEELLRRDLARVRDFFIKQGVKTTLSLEDALESVIGDYTFTVNMNDNEMATI